MTWIAWMRYFSSQRRIDYMPQQNISIIFGYPAILFRSKGPYICVILIIVCKIKKKSLISFCYMDRASFWEADYILSSNITGSLACKINDIAKIRHTQEKH